MIEEQLRMGNPSDQSSKKILPKRTLCVSISLLLMGIVLIVGGAFSHIYL